MLIVVNVLFIFYMFSLYRFQMAIKILVYAIDGVFRLSFAFLPAFIKAFPIYILLN